MRFCFVATAASASKLQEYIHCHNNIWLEVSHGLKAAGIRSLTIHTVPNTLQLVMVVETEGNLTVEQATGPNSDYRKNDTARRWEEMMATEFHSGWTLCSQIHTSDNWP